MIWIEIPAQRVLLVTEQELRERFEMVASDTDVLHRREDGRVFRTAPIQPCNSSGDAILTYLTEV